MEHRWNEIDRGKAKYLGGGGKLSKYRFVHHKSHMDWPRDRTRSSEVGGRRLTAWAMARPNCRLESHPGHERFLYFVWPLEDGALPLDRNRTSSENRIQDVCNLFV
jgi:hypothetical protein